MREYVIMFLGTAIAKVVLCIWFALLFSAVLFYTYASPDHEFLMRLLTLPIALTFSVPAFFYFSFVKGKNAFNNSVIVSVLIGNIVLVVASVYLVFFA